MNEINVINLLDDITKAIQSGSNAEIKLKDYEIVKGDKND